MTDYLKGHDDFVSRYMRFADINNSEAPAIYHRWVCFSMISAALGRQTWITNGPWKVYPNQYMMLMGSPGTRKGSAMSIGRGLLKKIGYNRFAADKTSKEQFLVDMRMTDKVQEMEMLDIEALAMDAPAESYIMSGEFTDFIGQGNMEFITMLTNLWDNLDTYRQPKITRKTVDVYKPTINLLGANTPEGFSLAFPPEALGNGFLSRVILLHAEPTSNRVAWPTPPDPLIQADLANRLSEVREFVTGEISISKEARELGAEIYAKEIPVDDPRFSHYQQRRFTHLLKNALVLAASEMCDSISAQHLRRSNTILAKAEKKMPRALGEFGASRYAMVSGKILSHLANSLHPQNANDLWRIVARDVSKVSELTDILQNLRHAEKIQSIQCKGKTGFLLNQSVKKEWPAHLLDESWLLEQDLF